PEIAKAAFGCGAGEAATGRDDAAAAGAGSPAGGFKAGMTSPLVIRPPRPVPSTLAASTARSAIILRAAGSAVAAPGADAGGVFAAAGAVAEAAGTAAATAGV